MIKEIKTMFNKVGQFFKNVWNWIKLKTKRFGRWIIGIIFGGVVIAQAIIPAPPQDTIVVYQDIKELTPVERQDKYVASERNYDGIQFEELRKQIDWKYNEAHDALGSAYYEGKEFSWNGKDYGVLDQDTFNKLQAMIWAKYEVLFHEENIKRELYEGSEYDDIKDEDGNVIDKKSDKAKNKIKELKQQGIDIDL